MCRPGSEVFRGFRKYESARMAGEADAVGIEIR